MNKVIIFIFILGIILIGLGLFDNHPETISDDVFIILGILILGFIPYYFSRIKSHRRKKWM